MNYWLLKSEPSSYSIDDMQKDKTTIWNGVRNYAARNNLKAMKKGDLCLFYHSVTNPAVVGLVEVVKESYQDPTTEDTAWVVVEVKFKQKFKTLLTLAEIKHEPALAQMDLLRLSRLSVQVVKKAEFDYIIGKTSK